MKIDKYTIHNFKIQVQTLSPLSIGDEGILSPLGDFVVSGDQLHYIDQKVLETELAAQPALIDKYVNGVGLSMNPSKTRANFNFYNFLSKDLRLNTNEFAKKTVGIYGLDKHTRKIQLVPIVRNGGQPYIPGSSLKGAIKTAVLYNWLRYEKGKEVLEKIIENIKRIYPRLEREIEARDELLAEKNRLRRNFDRRKNRMINDYRRKIREESKSVTQNLERLIEQLFGNIRDKNRKNCLDFSLLRISDSQCFEGNCEEVHYTKRLNIKKGSVDIPQCRETIKAGQSTTFDINIVPEFTHPDLKFFNSGNVKDLFDVLVEFSLDNLDYDSLMLEENGGKLYDENRRAYNALMDFYNDTMDEIENNKDCTYLRLGAGKTYLHNSIGLAIFKSDEEAYDMLVKIYEMGKPQQKLFPTTRTVTMKGFRQLGWVKLSKV